MITNVTNGVGNFYWDKLILFPGGPIPGYEKDDTNPMVLDGY
jgi:hypothetical protein